LYSLSSVQHSSPLLFFFLSQAVPVGNLDMFCNLAEKENHSLSCPSFLCDHKILQVSLKVNPRVFPTQAVRIGNLELFHDAAEKYARVFQQDKTRNLIVRLRHNVIRTGLRRINLSYSRISLKDVGLKLGLEGTVEDIESIVTKAIRDGGIDATVDHANG
jgi:hypothetical protein